MTRKSILIFLSGLLVGGVAIWGAAFLQMRNIVGHLYGVALADQVHTANMVRLARGEELAGSIERSLPDLVVQIDEAFPRAQGVEMAYGMVLRYYEEWDLEVPEEIVSILDRAP